MSVQSLRVFRYLGMLCQVDSISLGSAQLLWLDDADASAVGS